MNKEKYVDESWKEQASLEKNILAEEPAQHAAPEQISPNDPTDQAQGLEGDAQQGQAAEINFLNYITSLGFQAMIFLGETPNPVTNEVDKNLEQAKFLIDTLSMLKEKTEGNLNEQEKTLLENSVYELQMKYVQALGDQELAEEKKT